MWRIDPGSLCYAEELGRLLAELHAVPADEVAGTGLPVCSPEQVRQEMEAAGYRQARAHDFLPDQYFLVFERG